MKIEFLVKMTDVFIDLIEKLAYTLFSSFIFKKMDVEIYLDKSNIL